MPTPAGFYTVFGSIRDAINLAEKDRTTVTSLAAGLKSLGASSEFDMNKLPQPVVDFIVLCINKLRPEP